VEHFERRARSGLESAPVHETDRRLDLDLKSWRNVQNPFPLYAWLRDHDPVHWSASLNAWVVTRWADVARLFDHAENATLEEQLEFEAQLQSVATGTADFREGVAAFLEKREPRFEGR